MAELPAIPSEGGAGVEPTSHEATRILCALTEGKSGAADQLLAVIYEQLRSLASGYLSRERADHTLQPTALVHEAYLKLIEQDRVEWKGRAHFLAIGAQAMRRILVDHARARGRKKRGGDWKRVELDAQVSPTQDSTLDLVALDKALDHLRTLSERQAKIVELRFFGGLEVDAVAEVLEVSKSSIERDWRVARAWLSNALRNPG